jgi:hypothetical protein
MRLSNGFAAAPAVLTLGAVLSLGAAGLAGCSGSGSTAPRVAASTARAAEQVSPRLRIQARAAAGQAFGLYASGRFAAFWSLLSPAAKRQISRQAWLRVHEACPSTGHGEHGTVKAVTVFGNAAIVTEGIAGTPPVTAEVVFNYVNGQWSYSPEDLSVYHHRSVAADIAAAKAAGFCGSGKIF